MRRSIHNDFSASNVDKKVIATRRDLLPFNFCPAVGAALKVISLFLVMDSGVVKVDKTVLGKIPKQQRKKLITEGNMQLWRWLIVTGLNGEFQYWTIPKDLPPAKASLAQVSVLVIASSILVRIP